MDSAFVEFLWDSDVNLHVGIELHAFHEFASRDCATDFYDQERGISKQSRGIMTILDCSIVTRQMPAMCSCEPAGFHIENPALCFCKSDWRCAFISLAGAVL